MSMLFTINDSPFFGKDGICDFTTYQRAFNQGVENLALRVQETDSADKFMVFGRGYTFYHRNHESEGMNCKSSCK